MSDYGIPVTPSQILAGYHQKKNDFLRIDWKEYNEAENQLARYFTVQLWVKRGIEYSWAMAPTMMVKNAVCGKMKDYDEREKISQSGDRPSITFRKTTTYKREDGGIEKFGEAMCAISEAFEYQAKKAKEKGLLEFIGGDKIYCPVQTMAKPKYGDKNTPIEITNPVVRVHIQFRFNKKERVHTMYCDIHDLRKPIKPEDFKARVEDPSDTTAESDVKCERATINGAPLDLNNIHKFFPGGSRITGLIDLSNACVSKQGVSYPVKWQLIIAKPGTGRRHEGGALFNSQLSSLLEDATTMEIPEDQIVDDEDEGQETQVDTKPDIAKAPAEDSDDGVPADLNTDLKEAEGAEDK